MHYATHKSGDRDGAPAFMESLVLFKLGCLLEGISLADKVTLSML